VAKRTWIFRAWRTLGPGERSMSAGLKTVPISCSFCGKSQNQVKKFGYWAETGKSTKNIPLGRIIEDP
jgi:hypothetical protein